MLNKVNFSTFYACCKCENNVLKIQFLSLRIQTFPGEEFLWKEIHHLPKIV